MAIVANRIKTLSILPDLVLAFKTFCLKFFATSLILFSILLYYFSQESKLAKIVFDFSASYIIHPITLISDSIIDDVTKFHQSISSLLVARQENIALKLENARLQKLLSDATYLHSENKQLREQLRLLSIPSDMIQISGKVINVTHGVYKKSAIINLGMKNAIVQNQVAISNGAIVGKISQVADYNSTITLISDRQSRVPVITNISGIRAIFAGNGENGGELLYLQDTQNVKIGEILLSSGDGKYYPNGIPLAKITKKDANHVYAEPIANLGNIQFVTILHYKESE